MSDRRGFLKSLLALPFLKHALPTRPSSVTCYFKTEMPIRLEWTQNQKWLWTSFQCYLPHNDPPVWEELS